MGLVTRVLENLKTRREKVLSGGLNCIPSPFRVFRRDFPGVEQGKMYLLSGASKSGKTQLANFLFLYNSVIYAYYHPTKLRLQIFYFPWEETKEKIIQRFMCYLLYILSNKQIRVSPMELSSVDAGHVVDNKILELLNSIEYRAVLDFFEEHVHFVDDSNPTAVYKTINKYALDAGTVYKKNVLIENKETGVKQEKWVFDYYKPKDPDEYVLCIIDHISLCTLERGMSKKESMDKLIEYCIRMRNDFNYIPVVLQQQNSETLSLEAFKANKIAPTLNGLADTKDSGKACSIMLGITNPFSFSLPSYAGYDISLLKGYARFLEVVLAREGESNGVLAMYFDGAVNYFEPLPKPVDQQALSAYYKLVQQNMESASK